MVNEQTELYDANAGREYVTQCDYGPTFLVPICYFMDVAFSLLFLQ